jgi:hypothetical protein
MKLGVNIMPFYLYTVFPVINYINMAAMQTLNTATF